MFNCEYVAYALKPAYIVILSNIMYKYYSARAAQNQASKRDAKDYSC